MEDFQMKNLVEAYRLGLINFFQYLELCREVQSES